MKNYWLNRKKFHQWKRLYSSYGTFLIMVDHGEPEHLNISSQSMTCSAQDGKIFTKIDGEKKKETLEMIEGEFEIKE